ncbi:PAS domain S-box-containing protein [Belliella pelovolcani]|uniref:histidine kinase n=1 Tax=Belliella pelovolcani TaxID=529505 RepID=A0A1N7NA04_9BACT|nr:PAS domain S-box-containing protein [Belliella pelovolcani]
MNHCALLNLGYSSEEIKELTPVDIKPNYALDDFKKLVAPLINHQENKIVFFTIHQRKNQSTYPVEVHLQLVEERGIQEFLAIILDITDRKKAEIDMLNALEEKKKILESIGDAFFAMDKNYKVTYWNQTAEKLLHVKKDNILNKNLWDVFPDAINLPSYHNYKKVMETGEAITFEDYYGKWFEVNAYPAEDGISVFFRDIDYKKEAELEILKANERFQKVAQATADAIWDWDIANDQFYRTDGFEALFGYEVKKNFKEAEFWQDSFYLEDIPKVKGSLKKALADTTQEYWQAEYRVHHQTEGIKTVIDKGIIIRDESGKAIRMVGAMTDITERIKQEQAVKELNIKLQKHIKELELSNEQLEQFAFINSHDLQEPLRMITSFMNQLQRKYGGVLDEKAHQYIHFATDGARRMKQIILDLLEYSRAGNAMEDQIEIDLNELFAQYKILRRKVIQEKDVQFINHGLPKIMGPIAALTQTLHSLLDNAVKYTKQNEPPLIEISAQEESDHYIIQIKDHGIGIDAKFFDKIFIIFQRLHDKEQFDGTGLGLAVAKKHVDSWGGKIWVESTLGKGSSFYFTIKK